MRDASWIQLPESLVCPGITGRTSSIHVYPSCDGGWANLLSLPTALLLSPWLQHPVPKLSRFKPLFPHMAMQKKVRDSFTSLQTTLIATYHTVTYSPIAQTEVRSMMGSKKHVLCLTQIIFTSFSKSPLMCRAVFLYKCFSSIHPFQPPRHDCLQSSFSF